MSDIKKVINNNKKGMDIKNFIAMGLYSEKYSNKGIKQ